MASDHDDQSISPPPIPSWLLIEDPATPREDEVERLRAQARRIVTEFPSEVFTDEGREYFTANVNDAVTVVAGLLASHEQLRINQERLQARIDAALAVCEPHPLRHWDTQCAIRAALQGDQ